MSTHTPHKYTLEEISERKKLILNEIQIQKKLITTLTRDIFAPVAPAANKANSIMRSFNTGMAIFDGVMVGIKLMRKVRSYFKRLK